MRRREEQGKRDKNFRKLIIIQFPTLCGEKEGTRRGRVALLHLPFVRIPCLNIWLKRRRREWKEEDEERLLCMNFGMFEFAIDYLELVAISQVLVYILSVELVLVGMKSKPRTHIPFHFPWWNVSNNEDWVSHCPCHFQFFMKPSKLPCWVLFICSYPLFLFIQWRVQDQQ